MRESGQEVGARLRAHWSRVGRGLGDRPFKVRSPASETELAAFERRFHLVLPEDFRAYLAAVNGMEELDSDEEITSFWGLDRMKPIGEVYPTVSAHPDSHRDFVICDIIMDCFWYAIRLRTDGPDRGRLSMWGARDYPVVVARSFTEFAETYLEDPGSLPHGLPQTEVPRSCFVHGVPMVESSVSPWYGPDRDEPSNLSETAVREFPYSGAGHWGGEQLPDEPFVWREPVCPDCVAARRAWLEVNG